MVATSECTQVEALLRAHLAHDHPGPAHPERLLHEVAEPDLAGALEAGLPGLERDPVGVGEAQHKDSRTTDARAGRRPTVRRRIRVRRGRCRCLPYPRATSLPGPPISRSSAPPPRRRSGPAPPTRAAPQRGKPEESAARWSGPAPPRIRIWQPSLDSQSAPGPPRITTRWRRCLEPFHPQKGQPPLVLSRVLEHQASPGQVAHDAPGPSLVGSPRPRQDRSHRPPGPPREPRQNHGVRAVPQLQVKPPGGKSHLSRPGVPSTPSPLVCSRDS